jgi:hypothetical protein
MKASTYHALKRMQERMKDGACPICGKRGQVTMRVMWHVFEQPSDSDLLIVRKKRVRFLTHVHCRNCKIVKIFPFTTKTKITSEFANFYKKSSSEDVGIKPEGDISDPI